MTKTRPSNATSPLLIKVMLVIFVAPVVIQLNAFMLGLPVALLVGFLPVELQESTFGVANLIVQAVALLTGVLVVWKFWPKDEQNSGDQNNGSLSGHD